MDTKKVIKFTVITLIVAWIVQSIGSVAAVKMNNMVGTSIFQVSMIITMFIPMVVAIIVNKTPKGLGWKPRFKGCWYLIPICLFLPFLLSVLGAVVFFAVFPDMFDLSGSYMIAQGEAQGVDIMAQLEAQGLNYPMYMTITIISGVTLAPFVNMLPAIGEEAGWRGFLYPELNKKFGRVTTWIIGGTIWSAFHWPCIIIAGYEYGFEYFGYPITGILVFTLFCIFGGILEEVVYHKSKCVWYSALLHGALNAGNTALLFTNAENPRFESLRILGPFFNGLLSLIPLAVIACVWGYISIKKDKKNDN